MTVVIFLGIVLMWAVVLVPMWLRRHDEVEETRSLDRFSTAMHTLSRSDAPPSKKYVVMPHRSRAAEVHVSGAAANESRKRGRSPAQRRARAARRALTPAARRRRTLTGLLISTVVTVVLAVLLGGMALWALQVVVDACLVGFVAHLRNRARRARGQQPARRRPVATKRPAAARPARAAKPARTARPAATARPVRQPRPAPMVEPERVIEEPIHAPAAAVAAQREPLFDQSVEVAASIEAPIDEPHHVVYTFDDIGLVDTAVEPAPQASPTEVMPETAAAVAGDGEIGERPWEPVPVPRPVYTTKPTAPPRRRRAPIFEPLLPPVDSPAELDPVDDLEEILDRRWAVND